MSRAYLTGATREIKESLKKDGWTWDGRVWSKRISDQAAKSLIEAVTHDEKTEAAKKICGNKKGCMLTVDGIACWYSKSYASPANVATTATASARGDVWNHDAAGNYVQGIAIPGSDPDDRT